uniref:Lipoprotein n=1 Tax=Panagrolaimus superbus TaxID=310955 RepID=A0A914YUB8_9BILA
MNEELIWQFFITIASGSFVSIICISSIVTGCGKKKEKLVESACSKPTTQIQLANGSGNTGTPKDGSKTPADAKNSAEKKPADDKKVEEAAAPKEKTKEDEKKPEEEKSLKKRNLKKKAKKQILKLIPNCQL